MSDNYMKVEIEITKKDLRDILCSAMRNYYCNIKFCYSIKIPKLQQLFEKQIIVLWS